MKFKKLLKNLSKKELVKLIKKANKELRSRTYDIGDSVTITIEYMIGDADGEENTEMEYEINDANALSALLIFEHILTNETSSLEGYWGFSLNSESFSKRLSLEPYNLLYYQENAPKQFIDIEINEDILNELSCMVDELFRSETEYSFLSFQDYDVIIS